MAGELATLPLILGTAAFSLAAVIYLAIAILLLVAHPGTRQADWLVVALVVSAFWAAGHLVLAWRSGALVAGLPLIDAVHLCTWILFLASLLLASGGSRLALSLGRLIATGALVLFAIVGGQLWLAESGLWAPTATHVGLLSILVLSLLGLLALEQIYRNARTEQRPVLRWLVGGIGALLAADIFAYSQAMLFSALQPNLWVTSGLINAAAAPALLIAIKRQPDWGKNLYVSRQLAFYTTALSGAGVYLVAMGIGGFILGTRDEAWGATVQLLFLGLAGAVFLFGLYSSDVRRWFRIFVNKHFFRERYDYRDEWLRLSSALAGKDNDVGLAARGLRALADIVSSAGGIMWLERPESQRFEYIAQAGSKHPVTDLAMDDEMVRFVRRTQWVVDTKECLADPAKYSNAFEPADPWLTQSAIIVPLIHGGQVIGIAKLDRPSILGELNFKDHDLLKTAGQQVAVFLMQQRMQDALSESRQFEAYSKLTAFLMHDLKNLIAQQELVVGNAKRFRDRPDFIDDAIQTLDGSVKRMRRLLDRFRSMAAADRPSRIDLDGLVREVCDECSDREPRPARKGVARLHVSMDRDKLAMALTHAIRNAQDASAKGATIDVEVSESGGRVAIEVRDSGCGMDEAFMRDELFRPFSSTKGAKGMGIGAYQMRETLLAAGGELRVESEINVGTTMLFVLPVEVTPVSAKKQSVA